MSNSQKRIPTEEDWNNWKDDPPPSKTILDGINFAKEYYIRKSRGQITSQLDNHFSLYCDYLYDMPKNVFHYYIFALEEHISSIPNRKTTLDDRDYHASAFMNIIEHRAENNPKSLKEIIHNILPSLELIVENQEKIYDLDIDLYGNFKVKLQNIKALCAE
ncbi:MAG: hypothetical protein COB14_09760 [Alphaproteobacteria bacterium]|nr:MAG: hypothetical protein COB14_09760 [Alphaproteobacteria bacterium]